jgi:hypothetical protein
MEYSICSRPGTKPVDTGAALEHSQKFFTGLYLKRRSIFSWKEPP